MKIFQHPEALDQWERRIVGARPMRMLDIRQYKPTGTALIARNDLSDHRCSCLYFGIESKHYRSMHTSVLNIFITLSDSMLSPSRCILYQVEFQLAVSRTWSSHTCSNVVLDKMSLLATALESGVYQESQKTCLALIFDMLCFCPGSYTVTLIPR